MSFLSGLKVFGKDIVKVFGWLGSPKGQAVIGTGETLLASIVPGAGPIINLFNVWAQKAYAVEAAAAAAAQATGTGAQKADLVLQSIVPLVLQYAQQEGLAPRTAGQIAAANTALIAFINAMTGTDPATTISAGGTTPTA